MKFYVARTYSHTDRRLLWKILSRPMTAGRLAEQWKVFLEDEWTKEHPRAKHKPHFFVLAVDLPEELL